MAEIIDLGEVKVPVSWDGVTLAQYQEIEKFYENKDEKFNVIDVLDIFINKDKDYIMSLPAAFLNIIIDKLQFIQVSPKTDKPTNKITIDGEEYSIHFQNQLKTGEYIATETILKDDKHNYAALLAILCRKDGELYDSRFENEIIEDRIKMFEQQPITKILPIIGFFLNLMLVLNSPTQLSTAIKDEINRIHRHIETLAKNGEISKRYTKSLTKKLKKLEKSINSI